MSNEDNAPTIKIVHPNLSSPEVTTDCDIIKDIAKEQIPIENTKTLEEEQLSPVIKLLTDLIERFNININWFL